MIKLDIKNFINYGAIGIGVGLLGLSFKLLENAQNNPEIKNETIGLIWLFMILSAIVILLAFFKELLDNSRKRNEAIAIDPANAKSWGSDGNFVFKWYNAPYGMAIQELGDMNYEKMTHQGVKYKFLLIGGNSKRGKEIFETRYTLMNAFLKHLKGRGAPVESNAEVRVLKNYPIPAMTFYNLKKKGKDTTIFYLGQCVNDEKAWTAFQTHNKAIYHRLDHEFSDLWRQAEEVKIDELLT